MFNLKNTKIETLVKENMAVYASLMKTKKIEVSDLVDPIWAAIKSQYESSKDPISLDIISLLNSAYYQKRLIFSYSRKNAKILVKNDHQRTGGFNNNRYAAVFKQLLTLGIIEVVEQPTKVRAGIYRLKEPTLVEAISSQVDINAQYAECYRFISQNEDDLYSTNYKLKYSGLDEVFSHIEFLFSDKYTNKWKPDISMQVVGLIQSATNKKPKDNSLIACKELLDSTIMSMDKRYVLACEIGDLWQDSLCAHGADYNHYKEQGIPMPEHMAI